VEIVVGGIDVEPRIVRSNLNCWRCDFLGIGSGTERQKAAVMLRLCPKRAMIVSG
jgi:hypothetical protein